MDNLPVKKSHVVESGSGEGISEETPLINSKEKSINWSSLVLRNVLILLFWIGLSIFDLCKSQLIYKRINDAKTDKINSSSVKCGEVNGSLFEDESQTEASDWVWYLNLSQLCIAIPMIILFGIYSDVYGRRYPLVITLGSTAVLYGCTAMVSALNLDLHYLYIGFVISGLAGSNSNFLATATASIADVTSPSNTQSIAFAIIYLIAGIGYSSAEFGGGYIVKAYGFTWPLVFASCLCLVGSLLAFLRFTDEFERRGTGFKNVISNLKNVFCNNNHNKDITGHFPVWVFAMILCSLFFFFSVNDTREDIETLMELRSPFCWDAEYIGWFQSAESTMHMLIGPLCILILQKFFIDETIAVLGLVSGMLFYVMFGFAVNDWMIYTGNISVFLSKTNSHTKTVPSLSYE